MGRQAGKARVGRQKEFINEQTERFCKPLPALPQVPRARICAAKGLEYLFYEKRVDHGNRKNTLEKIAKP